MGICKYATASCKDNKTLHDAICYLQLKDSIEFKLDSITTPYTSFLQYYNSENIEVLSFLNSYDNSIYLYDYNTTHFIKKISFSDFGVKDHIQGYYMNKDIYAYSYTSGYLYILDTNKAVKQKFQMYKEPRSSEGITYPYPYLSTVTPMIILDSMVYSIGYRSGESRLDNDYNRPVFIELNLKNGKVANHINYPTIYKKYDWGGTMCYRLPYFTINDKDEFVISFPADHNLITGNLSNCDNIRSIVHPSNNIEIKPYNKFKRFIYRSASDVWDWYMTNYSYEGIVYDKYKLLYYRIMREPLLLYETGDKGNFKPISIIVMDANMKYKGTYKLPNDLKFRPYNIFVSPKGLNIQVLSNNEDVLKFYIYEYHQ